MLLLLVTMLLQWPGSETGPLATRIQQLFDLALTTDDEKQEAEAAAEVRDIFTRRGLPTIQEVGDRAAYEFVFLACSPSHMPFPPRVLKKARDGATRNEIPADAVIYCEAHLRHEAVKTKAKKRPPLNFALRERIEGLYRIDQAVRDKNGFNAEKMVNADRELAAELEAIFAKYGAPAYRLVGPEAASHFVVMIQHQSPEMRRRVLPKLKANVNAGQADPGAYAMMLDRSLTDSGKQQVYGENLTCDSQNPKLHTGPIEDENHVNLRRAAIGLMRLELYSAFVVRMSPNVCSAPSGS